MDGAGYNREQKGADGSDEPLSDIARHTRPTAQDGIHDPDNEVFRNEDRRAGNPKNHQEGTEYKGVQPLSINEQIDALENTFAQLEGCASSQDIIGNSPVEELSEGDLSQSAAPTSIFDPREDRPLLIQTVAPESLREAVAVTQVGQGKSAAEPTVDATPNASSVHYTNTRKSTKELARYPDNIVLIAGELAVPLPSQHDVQFIRDIDEPFGLLAILPGGDYNTLFRRLMETGHFSVPIADLTGGTSPRHDFVSNFFNEKSLNDALSATHRIRQTLNALPPINQTTKSDHLQALTLALSREAPIEAKWSPNSPDLVGYPLLSGLTHTRSILEQLAQSGFLTRHFFDRVHICDACGSSRIIAREVCTQCGGAHLKNDTLIHHYSCAEQAPRSHFEDGQNLTCPKCNRALRHYGVDYDAPSLIQLCRKCGEVNQAADVAFMCTDCGRSTPGDNAKKRDWYNYTLTPEGELAVLNGRLPSLGLASHVSGIAGNRTPGDLAVLIDFSVRVNNRYERPFSVIMITFSLPDHPPAVNRLRAETMVWDIVRGVLRETDFVAAMDQQIVLLLPETESENASIVVQRINQSLADLTGPSLQIQGELVPENKLVGLVDVLSNA